MITMAIPNYGYMNYPMGSNQIFSGQQCDLMTVYVQGEAGANAYPVASGNTVLLIDFDSGKFWLKSNINGVPQRLRAFSFSEIIHEPEQIPDQQISVVTRDEFDSLSNSVMTIANNLNKLVSELGGTTNE